MKRDKEIGYAEEILITKSDLEEKVILCRCAALELGCLIFAFSFRIR